VGAYLSAAFSGEVALLGRTTEMLCQGQKGTLLDKDGRRGQATVSGGSL